MKKLFISILAVAVLASCSKSDLAYTEQDSEIKLAPVTSMTTKANYKGSIDGTDYPDVETFRVKAYYTNPGFDENKVYLDGVEFAKKSGSAYWGGKDNMYYWPKNGYLNFACYSPASVSGVNHSVANDKFSVNYTQTNNTSETKDFMLAEKTAAYTAATADADVSVVFQHALSWITIVVKTAADVPANAFTVHDVIINKVRTTGLLEAEMGDGIQYKEWKSQATPLGYTVVDHQSHTLTAAGAVLEDAENGTVVIPQSLEDITLTINYTQNSINGSAQLANQTVTIPLAISANPDTNIWEPGKHYTYTVIFSLDEILINPSVTDWKEYGVDIEKNY